MRYDLPILAATAILLCTGITRAQFSTQYYKPLADDAAANDLFGSAIALSGHKAIVGVFSDDDNGSNSGSAYLFNTITGEQLVKFTASDGASNDRFGWAVAISGSTVIVGAKWDDDLGTNSGAAYLYDANSGLQIAKLVPSDGGSRDEFGYAVAIGGLPGLQVAAVGAFRDNDHGSDSGSVYLFDITTGQQLSKITPVDGLAFDWFGHALAIRGDTLIVGADGVDTNGTSSGAAYLYDIFDSANPSQITKLLASDGSSNDFFGLSVAINSTHAFVGSWGDDDLGTDSGSVYVFDIPSGLQVAKVLASDGASGDKFGRSIWASDTTLIAGAADDDDNGGSSGSAYLFDIATATQLTKLTPGEGESSDRFGTAVAINNTAAIIGATGDDIGQSGFPNFVSNSGAAYIFTGDVDSDGDGLYDDWELNGIPYFDAGDTEQRFMLPGANPIHKDLFVEVDAMLGLNLSNTAVTLLQTAFSNAPFTNLDGTLGINLHILRDTTDILPLVVPMQTDGCWPLDFDLCRSDHFGTLLEHGDARLLAAKAKAYRYCIIADSAAPTNIGGCGQRPGDNFVIFTGTRYNDEQQAAVFMHELGHNLNLRHGGGDSINGKPNYPSVMNYAFSYRYNWNRRFWKLDFSRVDAGNFVTLDESALNETVGIGTPGGTYRDVWLPFGVFEPDGNGNNVRKVKFVKLDGSMTDYGSPNASGEQDGIHSNSVLQDLNYVADPPANISLPGIPSFSEIITPYDDWANVSLPVVASLGSGTPGNSFPTDELTTDARDWIDANFPVPPGVCVVDLNNDNIVDVLDFFVFVSLFSTSDPAADLTSDGIVDVLDFFEFVNLFVIGCP